MKNNWEKVKLGEVLEHRRERPDPDKILLGEIPIVAKIGFDTGKIELRKESKTKTNMILIKPGDLVISGINAAKGAIAVYNENNKKDAAATIHYSSYKINNQKADKQYLWYFLRSNNFKKILIDSLPGGIKTEVRPKRLLPIDILLPPLEEQKGIVAKIEKLASKIDEGKKIREDSVGEVRNVLRSSLKNIFTGEYKRECLVNICETTSGGTPSRSRPDFFYGDIPWLKSGELNDGFISDSEEHITEEAVKGSSAKIFKKGTLLIALYGATVGKTGILQMDSATNQAICAIFPNDKVLERDYLHWFLKFKRNDFLNDSFGGAQPNISQRLLRKIEIPLPPINVQKKVVFYLNQLQSKLDKLNKLQEETEKDLEQLPPSILNKAFNGEL